MLGDGFDIPAGAGNFDRIIVTAAMEQIPQSLLDRLEPGRHPDRAGRPASGAQTLVRMTRTDAGFDRKELVDVRFVPALPGIAREKPYRQDEPGIQHLFGLSANGLDRLRRVKRLFTGDVFTQNSILLRTSE